jgi:hypothetical protein
VLLVDRGLVRLRCSSQPEAAAGAEAVLRGPEPDPAGIDQFGHLLIDVLKLSRSCGTGRWQNLRRRSLLPNTPDSIGDEACKKSINDRFTCLDKFAHKTAISKSISRSVDFAGKTAPPTEKY